MHATTAWRRAVRGCSAQWTAVCGRRTTRVLRHRCAATWSVDALPDAAQLAPTWAVAARRVPGSCFGLEVFAPPPHGVDLATCLGVSEDDTSAWSAADPPQQCSPAPGAAWLRQALAWYGVVVLRGVVVYSAAALAPALSAAFGRACMPVDASGSRVQVYTSGGRLGQRARGSDLWHSDNSYLAQPASVTCLYGVQIPSLDTEAAEAAGDAAGQGGSVPGSSPWETTPLSAGDTLFCHMGAAWAQLPADMRQALSGAVAEHDVRFAHEHRDGGRSGDASGPTDPNAAATGDATELLSGASDNTTGAPTTALHPVARRHPVAGFPCLYVSPAYTRRLVTPHSTDGADGSDGSDGGDSHAPADGGALLAAALKAAIVQDVCMRHTWRPGDLVLWDNASVVHRATTVHMPPGAGKRVLLRASVQGTAPQAACSVSP